MSQIRYVGVPSDRVHRSARKVKSRWMYVPKQKEPVGWVDVQLYLECIGVTLAVVVALFFTWFYAGL